MNPVMAVDAVDVTNNYGALRAVDGVSIQVAQGKVYRVLGPPQQALTRRPAPTLGLLSC